MDLEPLKNKTEKTGQSSLWNAPGNSPLTLLILMVGSIVIAEFFVHLLMLFTPQLPTEVEALVDVVTTLIFAFPFLYQYSFRPLVKDIALREEVEQTLLESQAYLQGIIEDQTELICRFNLEGTLTFYNRAFRKFFFGDSEPSQQRSFFDAIPQAEQPSLISLLDELTKERPTTSTELQVDYPHGKQSWQNWTFRSLYDQDGKLFLYQAVGTDITERRQLIEQLKAAQAELEDRVRARTGELEIANQALQEEVVVRTRAEESARTQLTALESAANAILVTDPMGRIQWCNPSFYDMTGYKIEEVLGKKTSILKSGIQGQEFYQHLWGEITAGKVWKGEITNRRKDGSLYIEEQTITPVMDSDGRVRQYISIKQDITDRKHGEERLKRRHWELSALNQLSQLLSLAVDSRDVFSALRQVLTDDLGLSCGAILVYQPYEDRVHPEVSWGLDEIELTQLMADPWFTAQNIERSQLNTSENGEGAQAKLVLPIVGQAFQQDLLVLLNPAVGGFSAEDVRLYRSLASQTGIAIEKVRLFRAEKLARKAAEGLREASLCLGQSLDMDVVLANLLDSLANLIPYDHAILFLQVNHDRVILRAAGDPGMDCAFSTTGNLTAAGSRHPVIERILKSQKGMLITCSDPEMQDLPGSCQSKLLGWIGLPFLVEGQAIGMCMMCRQTMSPFSTDDLRLAEALVGQASVAIHNARLYEMVATGRQELQALSRRLVDLQETERRYISRELHDQANQSLTYLIFALDMLKDDVGQPDSILSGIGDLKDMVRNILDELHRLAVALRPASLDHLGLIPALRQYIETYEAQHETSIHFDTQLQIDRLPSDLETSLYRIIQEALTNVSKHAGASQVDIQICQEPGKVIVTIRDNGVGFDTQVLAQTTRLGLIGMRERAEMLGGSLVLESQSGSGTTIHLEFPYAL